MCFSPGCSVRAGLLFVGEVETHPVDVVKGLRRKASGAIGAGQVLLDSFRSKMPATFAGRAPRVADPCRIDQRDRHHAATSSGRDEPRINALRPRVVSSGRSSYITTRSRATRHVSCRWSVLLGGVPGERKAFS